MYNPNYNYNPGQDYDPGYGTNYNPSYGQNNGQNNGQNGQGQGYQQWNPWGAALGGIGAGFGDLWHNQNPTNAAMPYLNNIPGEIGQYLNPYIQGGQGALSNLQQQYGNLLKNPTGVMNSIGAGYQASPGYNWQVNQATNAANRAGAAGGFLGSPMEQQNLANTVDQLANQNYYQYVDHGLDQYNRALQGEGNLAQLGSNAANEFAGDLGSLGESQANLAYSGAINQNQQQGGGWGSLLSGLGEAGSQLPWGEIAKWLGTAGGAAASAFGL